MDIQLECNRDPKAKRLITLWMDWLWSAVFVGSVAGAVAEGVAVLCFFWFVLLFGCNQGLNFILRLGSFFWRFRGMFLSMFGLLWFSAVFFWSFGGHFSGCNHRINFILWLDPFFWRFRGMFLSMFGLLGFSAVFFWSFGGDFSGCNHRLNFSLWLGPFFWRFRGMFLSMFGLLGFSAVFLLVLWWWFFGVQSQTRI